jgi:hypothetical protein
MWISSLEILFKLYNLLISFSFARVLEIEIKGTYHCWKCGRCIYVYSFSNYYHYYSQKKAVAKFLKFKNIKKSRTTDYYISELSKSAYLSTRINETPKWINLK